MYLKQQINKNIKQMTIPTISENIQPNNNYKIRIIKRNFFGHRWILQINHDNKPQNNKGRKIVTILISALLLILISAAIAIVLTEYLSNDRKISPTKPLNNTKIETVIVNNKLKPLQAKPFCDCLNGEICIKIIETEKPKCMPASDKRDPTGCGGLCQINTEICKILDHKNKVHQCLKANKLQCPITHFNCGTRCILQKKRCDGKLDCANFFDELNCDCNLQTHFQCSNKKSCLEKRRKCDGAVDCWDKSDEINCTKGCAENLVQCLNGQCIEKNKFCNGIIDCQDKSDEPELCKK